MRINEILSADLLDIIFEGRYKEYGAYELRKSYNKRITYAVIGTVAICLGLFIGSILANSVKKTTGQVYVEDVSLVNMKTEKEKAIVPPPIPPPKQDLPKVEISKFNVPKIVKDNKFKPEDEIKENKTLENTIIGDFNKDGIKGAGLDAPVIQTKGTSIIAAPNSKEDDNEIFRVVQIPAQFPGGLQEWIKFLQRNLNSSLPAENGAPPAKYTVFVTFIVDKIGRISDVQSENDPGYGTKEEAIRVIKKGPNWIPAIQNGRNVIYRHKQGITFDVQAE